MFHLKREKSWSSYVLIGKTILNPDNNSKYPLVKLFYQLNVVE